MDRSNHMTDEIETTLQDVGLTEYQSRAYVTSVRLGTARFTVLAEEAEIPQQRIYDVVDDLQEFGLVEVNEASTGKEAVAIPPEVGLEELKNQQVSQFESRFERAMDQLDTIAGDVDRPSGYVTVVNHESSTQRHVSRAIETADWWLFLSLPMEWYGAFKAEVREALDRGVTVRLLVQTDDVVTVENTTYHEDLLVNCRQDADLVVAADRDYGIFRGLSAPSVSRPSLVTRQKSIVEMFQRYSEQLWLGSREIATPTDGPRRYLTPWRAIIDYEAALDADTPVEAYVEGHDTDTGQPGTWVGPVVDYTMRADRDADYRTVLPEIARIVVETETGSVSVGGWDAVLEDVAAYGLEIRAD